MANDNSINERGGINVPLSGGGYASIFAHRPLKVKKSKKNPKLIGETYDKEVTEKWMEKTIRDSARAHGHDPDTAAALWRSEGGMSRQSTYKKGKGNSSKSKGNKKHTKRRRRKSHCKSHRKRR